MKLSLFFGLSAERLDTLSQTGLYKIISYRERKEDIMTGKKRILVFSTPECSDNMHADGPLAKLIENKYSNCAFQFKDADAVTREDLHNANVIAGRI